MGHTSITLGLLLGLTAAASQLPGGLFGSRDATRASAIAAQAVVERDAALQMQDATAAAVVESLRSRFAGREIEFKFDSFDSRPLSQRDMQLRGAGQFRIEGGQAWLPMRYAAIYDTSTGSVESPDITFTAQAAKGRPASVDATALDTMVGRQLAEEFASQSVDFDLGRVRPVASDGRYLMVDGSGIARFEGEGAAMVSVQAVLDRATGQWLGVSYALGGEAA